MKLANALSQRSELQTRIRQLEDRLDNNAQVQEGEQPAEDPMELLRELEADYARLEELIARINRTNSETRTEQGTITQLLARWDVLKLRTSMYHNFLMSASCLAQRATRSGIKIMSTVPVAEYRKKADGLSRELRELDTKIQGLNWTTELL